MHDDSIKRLLEIEDLKFSEQEIQTNAPPPAPYTVKSWLELKNQPLPPRETFLGEVFALGCVQAIVGQGGLGKSRMIMNIARNNVLGMDFCGLSTGSRPLKWLLLGNENSMHRMKSDIEAMSQGLNAYQMDALNSHIFIHSLETPDDSFICLSDDKIKDKWRETVLSIMPDIISVDPWGEVQYGDPNNDLDTRQSIRELVRICSHASPKSGIVILHHARTGRANISQAAGWDKANFGKGSKALYSGARAMVNLAPADPEDNTRIVMVCAKSNDAPPFETKGIKLVEDTMTYEIDETFDFEAWSSDVEGKRQPGNSKGSVQDVIDGIAEGNKDYKSLVAHLAEVKEMASRTADKWIGKAVKTGYVRKRKNGDYVLSGKAKPRLPVEVPDNEDVM
jgi:hypothetical protein